MEEARRDAGVSRRLQLQNRFYDAIRSRSARRAADGTATRGSFDSLRGHKYGLVVTFKRDGSPVPTPVWFGLDADGRLYFRTGAAVAKVKRIRNQPRVLDLQARKARLIEKVPDFITDEVLAKLSTLIE